MSGILWYEIRCRVGLHGRDETRTEMALFRRPLSPGSGSSGYVEKVSCYKLTLDLQPRLLSIEDSLYQFWEENIIEREMK